MLKPPRALLFDMDGTLTVPALDFPQIKAEMGIGTSPILEALAAMSPEQRERAESILHKYEDRVAANSVLNNGCDSLFSFIIEKRIPTALITRNTRRSVATFLERHSLTFDLLITREDPPYKPDPHPLLLACRKLSVDPADAWMIGDGVYDIEAARAADIKSIWISHNLPRPFAAEPWQTLPDLCAVHASLKSAFSTFIPTPDV
jgi:HAD superfamily hydrolase (TIGR01549 family)